MKYINMIKISVVVFVVLISACAVEENSVQQVEDDSIQELNEKLTGTWVSSSVNTSYDNSNTLVGTEKIYSTFYFTESNTDIQLSNCEDYSNPEITPFFLRRDNDELSFIDISDIPFTIVSTTELTREYEIPYSFGKTFYNQTLTKISSTIDLSRGSLQVNGPISASNREHVCLLQSFSLDNQHNSMQLSIPFDNRDLRLGIQLTELLTVGNYQYNHYYVGNTPVLYDFYVSSISDMFWNTIGNNNISPNQANLEIISVESDRIEGSFSFVSQDGGNYTGIFNYVPYSKD